MPRQFKVTVNGREYDVSVLELNAGQLAPSAAPAAVAAAPQAGGNAPAPAVATLPSAAAGAGDRDALAALA